MCLMFFFFNDTATTEIYTLSLHDALPILIYAQLSQVLNPPTAAFDTGGRKGYVANTRLRRPERDNQPATPPGTVAQDRKSTRLNSSHANISYAVFCLKKKNK